MPNELFVKNRQKTLFHAVAHEKWNVIRDLLGKNPQLIHTRSGTTELTLLHLAAIKENILLCDYLISLGHAINPLNKLDITPYQMATSDAVRLFLANQQLTAYISEYASIRRERIGTYDNEFQTLSNEAFDEIAGTEGHDQHFIIQRRENCDYVYFRADSLMQPYLGPLFVIQVNLILTYLYSRNATDTALPHLYQTHIYMICINHASMHFPFLNSPSDEKETPDIESAKLLFKQAFLANFLVAFHQCNDDEQEQLTTQPHSANVIALTESSLNPTLLAPDETNEQENLTSSPTSPYPG